MNKYFIEYTKYQLYVCFDGLGGFVNSKSKHNDHENSFLEFVSKNNRLVSAFKIVLKLRNKNNLLHLLLCMIIDQFNMDPKKDKKGEFK